MNPVDNQFILLEALFLTTAHNKHMCSISNDRAVLEPLEFNLRLRLHADRCGSVYFMRYAAYELVFDSGLYKMYISPRLVPGVIISSLLFRRTILLSSNIQFLDSTRQ